MLRNTSLFRLVSCWGRFQVVRCIDIVQSLLSLISICLYDWFRNWLWLALRLQSFWLLSQIDHHISLVWWLWDSLHLQLLNLFLLNLLLDLCFWLTSSGNNSIRDSIGYSTHIHGLIYTAIVNWILKWLIEICIWSNNSGAIILITAVILFILYAAVHCNISTSSICSTHTKLVFYKLHWICISRFW